MNEKKQGHFIVIDGTDGSGKATQTAILAERLKRAGFAVEVADFPQYGKKSAGLVEEYLNGRYGSAEDIGPYRGSIFYAVDRFDASSQIRQWLDEGKIVISNRYVTANMAHQGSRIKDGKQREAYFDWLYNLEYEIFGIPRPDLNIILHVDAEIAQQMVDQKDSRDYINGKKRDILEADLNHLRDAEKVYLEIARSFPNFSLIECTRDGRIMSREEINDLLWAEVSKIVGKQEKSEKLNVEKIAPHAILPSRAHPNDAGLDLYSLDNYTLFPGDITKICTGIKMEIPAGYTGLIWDKSGMAARGLKTMGGVIDSDYRGEIIIIMKNLSGDIVNIEKGQKVAQILIQKIERFNVVEHQVNTDTDRGNKGFGSSGLF